MTTEGPRPSVILKPEPLRTALGLDLLIATETFQHTGSFKFRAAHRLVGQVSASHLITASSGNFGQALAFACRLAGKRCTVVMPNTSSSVKVEGVRAFGGEVVPIDVARISRAERVAELARDHPEAFVASAYDDPHVIEGNSSLGDEIIEHADPDVIVAPVGGGGLAAGLMTALLRRGAEARLVGAEPLLGNDAARSVREDRLIRNEAEPPTIADGARTVSLGKLNWECLRGRIDGIVEVPEPAIVEALRRLFVLANLKVEPTGALAVAAAMIEPERFRDQRVCCVVSGGNVEPEFYARLLVGA